MLIKKVSWFVKEWNIFSRSTICISKKKQKFSDNNFVEFSEFKGILEKEEKMSSEYNFNC